MTSLDTLLVIPTYRDGARLMEFLPGLCAELARSSGGVQLQVVDDGSPAAEQSWLTTEVDRLRRTFAFLQPLLTDKLNHGKGHAIRTGWATSPQMRWLAFVDADGAVPAVEVAALLGLARNSVEAAIFIAVRMDQPGKPVKRFWYRRFGSRVFNAWVRLCLGLDYPDTQCGLKVIPAAFFAGDLPSFREPIGRRTQSSQESDPLANQPAMWREDGFAFDLELLLRARAVRLPVVAQPIAWSERTGSSLGPGAMLRLFAAVWRLRTR